MNALISEHGHSAPPDEVLDFLALLTVKQARLPLRRGGMGLPAAMDERVVSLLMTLVFFLGPFSGRKTAR